MRILQRDVIENRIGEFVKQIICVGFMRVLFRMRSGFVVGQSIINVCSRRLRVVSWGASVRFRNRIGSILKTQFRICSER